MRQLWASTLLIFAVIGVVHGMVPRPDTTLQLPDSEAECIIIDVLQEDPISEPGCVHKKVLIWAIFSNAQTGPSLYAGYFAQKMALDPLGLKKMSITIGAVGGWKKNDYQKLIAQWQESIEKLIAECRQKYGRAMKEILDDKETCKVEFNVDKSVLPALKNAHDDYSWFKGKKGIPVVIVPGRGKGVGYNTGIIMPDKLAGSQWGLAHEIGHFGEYRNPDKDKYYVDKGPYGHKDEKVRSHHSDKDHIMHPTWPQQSLIKPPKIDCAYCKSLVGQCK